MIKKIISGGQTGVDRAALDVAITLNIQHGGWCPYGRIAEDGVINNVKYKLTETIDETDPIVRTKRNVHDSDATLIFYPSIHVANMDGTIDTINFCKELHKIYFLYVVDVDTTSIDEQCINWLLLHDITYLNVAGPRASNWPSGYQYVKEHFMKIMMEYMKANVKRR